MERREAILEAIRQGQSYTAIGKQFGISRQRIQQIARDAGIVRRLPVARDVVESTTFLEKGTTLKDRLRFFFLG